MNLKNIRFSRTDIALWTVSVMLITATFLLFDRQSWLSLAASLIGVTSLIFNARGYAFDQLLIIVFSLIYGVLSYREAYYGEMITYLGMTMPMAAAALISWIRHPSTLDSANVQVSRMPSADIVWMLALCALVTFAFYWILRALHAASLPMSTLSVTTSFLAVWLTFKRSASYALGYAANDLVLIILWMATLAQDPSAVSMVVCFAVFLINDLYGYFSWSKMRAAQEAA